MMKDESCAYCGDRKLADAFGIKLIELPASKVYLFREQSHPGRIIVASKRHVGEIIDLPRRERQEFLDDVARAANALRKAFGPDKINYGAYGDTCGHLHFHLVPKYASDSFEWGDTFAMNPKRRFLSDSEYADLAAKLAAELYVGDVVDFRKALTDMRRDIGADGKVELCETAVLLAALTPLAGTSAAIDAFVQKLLAVRADGKVTSEESAGIIRQMDELLA